MLPFITSCPELYKDPTNPLFFKLKTLKFKDIVVTNNKNHKIKFMYTIKNKKEKQEGQQKTLEFEKGIGANTAKLQGNT